MKTKVEKHFDSVANKYDSGKKKYSYYYESLKKLLGSLIPQNKNVFEVGCGTGDLIASLNPKLGYGMDISQKMIIIANKKHSKELLIHFSTKWPKDKFDFIFMSDVIEHLEKPEETFKRISKLMDKKSKFVITMANPIWEPVLMIAEKLCLKMPEGPHKRISNFQLSIFIEKSGMKVIKHDYKLLIPIEILFLTNFINRYLERYLKRFAFVEYFVAIKV